MEGDEEGEWTFLGSTGESLDYAIVNEEAEEEIVKFEVEKELNRTVSQ